MLIEAHLVVTCLGRILIEFIEQYVRLLKSVFDSRVPLSVQSISIAKQKV